jgi:glycerol-3-phosphate dehydrogenase
MRRNRLLTRSEAISRLENETFDLLIIGGGITGVGAAQDAAARGLKVALVERGDYAIGTSSKSSKLIHGGLRYLAQGDFRVTYESCAERALLQILAPHLVKSRTFLIPVYRWPHGLQVATGLWLYDIISKLKNTTVHKRVNIKKALEFAPTLETQGLRFAYLYQDCQTNDARLVMEVTKSASSYGAVAANYLEVIDLIKAAHSNAGAAAETQDRIAGARARDLISGREIAIRATVVVNATGVWMDRLRQIDEPDVARKVRPAKGTHILIARSRIATTDALLFESAANDGRSLFFIPWYEGTIIGTTDTDYQGEIDAPRSTPQDIEYILAATQRVFPKANLTADDILSSYAGLRPLIDEGGKSTKDISREHKIFESKAGLISIAGGKLTTYRRMARSLVDHVLPMIKSIGSTSNIGPSCTDKIYLSGFEAGQSLAAVRAAAQEQAQKFGLDAEVTQHLVDDYGVNALEVISLISYLAAPAIYSGGSHLCRAGRAGRASGRFSCPPHAHCVAHARSGQCLRRDRGAHNGRAVELERGADRRGSGALSTTRGTTILARVNLIWSAS